MIGREDALRRVFIGIALEPETKKRIQVQASQWFGENPSGRVTDPSNYHLTLLFIGDVDAKRLEELIQIVDGAAEDRTAFVVPCDQLGTFPKRRRFIVWMGTRDVPPELMDLYRWIARRVGIRPESDLVPHITLMRGARDRFDGPLADSIVITVDRMTLFESRRESTGLHYVPIHQSKPFKTK